jgi:pyruvate/2-oxoglutarate dehydrogenase complex dihydrolipoamide acyltransferase (E2) component
MRRALSVARSNSDASVSNVSSSMLCSFSPPCFSSLVLARSFTASSRPLLGVSAPVRARNPLRFPSVGKLLYEKGLDWKSVEGSGRLGQILKSDALRAKKRASPAATPSSSVISSLFGKDVPHRYAVIEADVGVLLKSASDQLGSGGLAACVLKCIVSALPAMSLSADGQFALVELVDRSVARASVPLLSSPEATVKALGSSSSSSSTPSRPSPLVVLQDFSVTGLSSVVGVLPAGAAVVLTVGAPRAVARAEQTVVVCSLSLAADATRIDEDQAQQFLAAVAKGMKQFGLF